MKARKSRILFFLMAMILLLSACGKGTAETSSAAPEAKAAAESSRDYITLLYSASDSFNPYQAKTDINRQLCRLLYEPLVKTDDVFQPVYCLANSVTVDGKTCVVRLESRVFSDGSPLTAEDVTYSFQLAKQSESEYAQKLYEAASVTVRDASTVVFTMTKADPYFANLLDFPILKRGSDRRVDVDDVALPPIGCGRYVADDAGTRLTLNEKTVGNAYPIKEIRLINAPDAESISHYVEINATDLYFNDISDGNIIRMSGNKVDINLNHLVFLAVNRNVGGLAANELRQALSSGIDREAVCRECYYNNALPATGFYNPAFEPVRSVQNIETKSKKEITVANLEKIGYNTTESGITKNGKGAALTFSLLVNEENRIRVSAARLIAAQLAECGIQIQVRELNRDAYRQALAEGNFQLCLTEVAITPNMDLSELVREGGSVAFGLPKTEENTTEASEASRSETAGDETAQTIPAQTAAQLVEGIYTGANTFSDAAQALQDEMPFIPICYRTGVLFYNKSIQNVKQASVSDIYFSIDSYSIFTK